MNGFRSPVHTKLHGTLLFLSATLFFAILDATAKYMSGFFPVPLLVWARYFVHMSVMLAVVAPGMGRQIVVTRRPRLMVLRALMLVGCTLFVMLAFRSLPLAETTALVFVSPLIVALLAGPLLGETLNYGTWLATIAGFCGVLLIARPGGAMFGPGIAYALAAALCNAIYQILTRKLSASEPPLRQLFYTALVGAVAMSFTVPAYWTGDIPNLRQILLIASLGLYGGIGHFLFIRAYHEAPASTLAPLNYIQLIWATLLGWAVFGQLPDLLTATGMLIIGVSSLSIALRRPRAVVCVEPS